MRHCLPCLATLPVDGFAGYDAIDAKMAATVITSALYAAKVCVSADVSAGGSIHIMALDDRNNLVDEAEAITAEVTDAPLRWKRGEVAGKPLRFEVRLDHARLYAISGVELVHEEMKKPSKSSNVSSRTPHPILTKSLSFNDEVQGWMGVDQIEHHRDGGAKGGFVRITRSGRALPIAMSPATAKDSPLAGDWTMLVGGKGEGHLPSAFSQSGWACCDRDLCPRHIAMVDRDQRTFHQRVDAGRRLSAIRME